MVCTIALHNPQVTERNGFASVKGKQDGSEWSVQVNIPLEMKSEITGKITKDTKSIVLNTVVVIPKVTNGKPWLQMFIPKGSTYSIH